MSAKAIAFEWSGSRIATKEAPLSDAGYQVIRIDDIPAPDEEKAPGGADWRAVRIHFGISSFGVNAYSQPEAGKPVIGEHGEIDTRHEELYYVARGHATFTIEGEEIDAPEGTLVYVPDPGAMRSAVAQVAGTTVVCVGGTPGRAFSVSDWERKYDPAAAR
jgi:hypothetical protein